MKTKQYIIGEYSRRFLSALDKFQEFKEEFFEALQHQYGEEPGERLFQEHVDKYDALERVLMDYFRYNLTMEMGTDKETITI